MDSRIKRIWLYGIILLITSCQSPITSPIPISSPAPSLIPLPIPTNPSPIPTDSRLSPIPLPFEYIETPPENQFILIAIGDNDWTCLDGFCNCTFVEAAAHPFDFSNGVLQIDPYHLQHDDNDRLLIGTDLWPSIRKSNQSIGLFGFYGANTDIYLSFISSFPFNLDRFGFEILGFDAQGSIQIKTKDGYIVLLPNEKFVSEQPELRYENCKVLNQLTLKNYGFISDSNAVFSIEFVGSSGEFPP